MASYTITEYMQYNRKVKNLNHQPTITTTIHGVLVGPWMKVASTITEAQNETFWLLQFFLMNSVLYSKSFKRPQQGEKNLFITS